MMVLGGMTAETFTEEHRNGFKQAVATTVGVEAGQVAITSVSTAPSFRRQLAEGLTVNYEVSGLDTVKLSLVTASIAEIAGDADSFSATLTSAFTAAGAAAQPSGFGVVAYPVASESSSGSMTPHLRIGTVVSPPFVLLDGPKNVLSGYLIEMFGHMVGQNLSSLVAGTNQTSGRFRAMNFTFTFSIVVAGDHEAAVAKLTAPSPEFDIILADMHVTPARTLVVDFSPSWQLSGLVPIRYTKADGKKFAAFADIGIRAPACVYNSSTMTGAVELIFPGVQQDDMKLCTSVEDCVAMLKNGDCDMIVEDKLNAKYQVAVDSELQIASEAVLATKYLAFPARRGLSSSVFRAFNYEVVKYVEEGHREVLDNKFLTSSASAQKNSLDAFQLDIVVVVQPPYVYFDPCQERCGTSEGDACTKWGGAVVDATAYQDRPDKENHGCEVGTQRYACTATVSTCLYPLHVPLQRGQHVPLPAA
jgi:ABC-type amino acid transport substrate-binding protein